MANPQTYKTHTRVVPVYHVGVLLPLLANFGWTIYRVFQEPTGDRVMSLLVAVALLLMFFSVRAQILTVQDRVIRLEMRHRLRAVLPADLSERASALPVKQLIALRFASDEELPELVGDVIGGKLTEPKQIKLRISEWQGDHLRA